MERSRDKDSNFRCSVRRHAEIELASLRKSAGGLQYLNADRATLFERYQTDELFSRVAMGDGLGEIRLPNDAGIAGAVFNRDQP